MRLIDADKIKWEKCEDIEGNPIYLVSKKDVEKQPTAFDKDKVIEELELNSFALGNNNLPISYVRLDKAIEIVERGGNKCHMVQQEM